jgi:hypothetical protein
MPNPGSLISCRGPKTYAVSWRTENQIVNPSYHKNSPDPVEGYWITHNLVAGRIAYYNIHHYYTTTSYHALLLLLSTYKGCKSINRLSIICNSNRLLFSMSIQIN